MAKKYKHPSYKKMILSTMKFLNNDNLENNTLSYDLIKKSMINFYILNDYNEKRIKQSLHTALNGLVRDKNLVQHKNSFRYSTNFAKKQQAKISNGDFDSKIHSNLQIVNKKIHNINSEIGEINRSKDIHEEIKPQKFVDAIQSLNQSNLSIEHTQITDANDVKVKINPIKWQYYDFTNSNLNKWIDFDSKSLENFEGEWQNFITNSGYGFIDSKNSNSLIEVNVDEFRYQLDFLKWQLTKNIHPGLTIRNIRRLDEKGQVTINPVKEVEERVENDVNVTNNTESNIIM